MLKFEQFGKEINFGHIWTSMDKIGQNWTSLERFGQVLTSLERFGQGWTSLEKIGQVWARLDKFGLDWTIKTNLAVPRGPKGQTNTTCETFVQIPMTENKMS